jgi:hypothetical protein
MVPSEPPSTVTNLTNQLSDLTNQLKHLPVPLGPEFPSGKEFRLSPAAAQNYMDVIQSHRQLLTEHLSQIAALPDYGNVGNLPSAQSMKQHLTDARPATHALLTSYHAYFCELEKLVQAFFNRMQADDLDASI